MTREEAVLKAINEGVKIRPVGGELYLEWFNFSFDNYLTWEAEPQQVTIVRGEALKKLREHYSLELTKDILTILGFK